MDSSYIVQIIILFFLIILSTFFSSAETALTTVSKLRMRTLAEGGNNRATLVLDITENHSAKMLSMVLTGNNVVNISASALATSVAFQFGGIMVSIVTALITIIILVFAEITPKNYATLHSEKISLRYIYIVRFLMFAMTPLIFIVNGISRGLFRLLRIDPDAKTNTITEDELRTLVDVIHEDGVIETEEKEMINNVFDLGDAQAREVMIPRVNMSFANVNNTYWELIEIYKRDRYTRLPVYEETTDNVIGTINIKDLLLYDDRDNFNVHNILREAYFTYELKNISELLTEMRDASINIAIVLDEYGDTAGLITLEDILEEIVGEIRDEYDESELELFKELAPNEYLVEGSVGLDDVNDSLGIELLSDDYDSLGGYFIEHLDKLPEVGDQVITDQGVRLVVDSLDKNRVKAVHVYLPEQTGNDSESESIEAE